MESIPSSTDHQALGTGLADVLAQSAFVTMGALTKLAGTYDLSLTQLRVLAILRDRRLRISELAQYLGLEKSTLTGLVSRAEKRGLLAREPSHSDKRAVEVFLRSEGQHLAGKISSLLEDNLASVSRALSPAEQAQLKDLLERAFSPQG